MLNCQFESEPGTDLSSAGSGFARPAAPVGAGLAAVFAAAAFTGREPASADGGFAVSQPAHGPSGNADRQRAAVLNAALGSLRAGVPRRGASHDAPAATARS